MGLNKLWLGLVLLWVYSHSFAKESCSTATEYNPVLCQITLPHISSIKIEENAISADNKNNDCSSFKLTTHQVQRYFTKALQIQNTEDAEHKLDWLPCSSRGTLRFTNGKKAIWGIGQDQTGVLVLESGKEINLYCPDCKFKPFLW
jgi:hypothetical protein